MKNKYFKILIIAVIAFVFSSNTIKALPISPPCVNSINVLYCGLVGYWTFDGEDMINGVAKDLSANGNNANLINISTSTFYTVGKMRQAFNFDGINNYLNAGSDSTLDDVQNFNGITISFWIKPKSNSTKTIFTKGDGTDNSGTWSVIKSSATNPARLIFNKEGSTDSSVYYDNFFTNDVWQHVVITWNAFMIFSSGVKVYKNSFLVSQSGVTDGATSNSDASSNLYIGGDPTNSSFSDNTLDDVRIYKRVLRDYEIAQLYNLGASNKLSVSPNFNIDYCNNNISCYLVGWWTFDGKNISNNVIDSSNQGNNGYLSNITSTSSSVVVGKTGQGLRFDGIDDYIVTKNTVNIPKTTISAWIKINSIPSSNILITGFMNGINASSYDKDLYIDTSGKLRFYVYDGSGKTTSLPSNPIPFNTWVHVVGTADGSNAYAYVNGVQVGSVAAGNTYTSYTVPNIFIQGQTNSVGTSGGYGPISIDDVRVYSKALSSGEIGKLYNSNLASKMAMSQKIPNTTNCNNDLSCGLLAYWTFDGKDMVNGSLSDNSGNSHIGTLVNISTSTFYTSGKIGQAISLNTSQNSAVHISGSFPPPVSGFSMSLWMKTTQTGSPVIFGWGNRFMRLGGVTANKLSFIVDGTSGGSATTLCDANNGKWHHIVISSTASSQSIYCDGVSGTSATETLDTASAIAVLGKALTGDTAKYNGLFDDMRIYNRPLSAGEVIKLYNMGSNR